MHAYQNYLLASDEAQTRLNDDRSAARHPVDSAVPWRLVHVETGFELKLRVVDVSPRGLGVFVERKIELGDRFILRCDDREILMEVAHCSNCLGIETLFRAGLFLRSYDENLVSVFRAAGFLKR